jgi:acetyl esterase/lipase
MWARAFSALAPSSTSKIPSINYMEGADPADPLANPTVSDVVLARFPPTLFITGTRAHDMSHVITAHARLLKLGVESSLYVMEGFGHAADLTANGAPEQRDVNAYKARWFDQHLLR